jgi:glutaredoxin 3
MQIKMFTKDVCSYCAAAKDFFKDRHLEFTEFKIGEHITREDFVKQYPDYRTVPQIFINDEHVGGYDDLVKDPRFK